MPRFFPYRSPNMDARLRHIEQHLCDTSSDRPNPDQFPNGSDPTGRGSARNGATVGTIREAQVIFDPGAGHSHDGAGSHTVAMTGDVTGANNAAVVAQIQGKAIAAPVSGNDKQFVRYDNGGSAFVYANASTNCLLGAWSKADISTLAGADALIDNSFSTATVKTLAVVCPIAGQLTALSVKLSASAGAGNTLVVTVYKNGVATALTGTVNGSGTPNDQVFVSGAAVTFAAGDTLTVEAHITGAPPAGTSCVATVWGFFTG